MIWPSPRAQPGPRSSRLGSLVSVSIDSTCAPRKSGNSDGGSQPVSGMGGMGRTTCPRARLVGASSQNRPKASSLIYVDPLCACSCNHVGGASATGERYHEIRAQVVEHPLVQHGAG